MAAPNEVAEAYKSIIDFNKTIIGISSSILAGLIGFIVYQQLEAKITNYISVVLLVFSVFFSIKSFGAAIKTIKDLTSRPSTITYANWGAVTLICGILSVLFITQEKKTISDMLNDVNSSTMVMQKKLHPNSCYQIYQKNDNYVFKYLVDKQKIIVVYSAKKSEILSIK